MLVWSPLSWHMGWQVGCLDPLAFSPNTPKHSGSLGSSKLPALQSLIYYRAGGREEGTWARGWAHESCLQSSTPPPALAPSVEEILSSASCMRHSQWPPQLC